MLVKKDNIDDSLTISETDTTNGIEIRNVFPLIPFILTHTPLIFIAGNAAEISPSSIMHPTRLKALRPGIKMSLEQYTRIMDKGSIFMVIISGESGAWW